MPEYPAFAWQEALVNAVAHRDYRQQGRSVEVWLFDDRMEVLSPGSLPFEVDVERLRRRERVHCSRNPRMTRVLAEMALMREQGEGPPRVFEEMEQSWLQLPELRAEQHSFVVVLRNKPIFETPDPEWVRHVETLAINIRQRRVLVAYPKGTFANADYQSLNDVDRDTAYRELMEMVRLKLVESSGGRGRGARYRTVTGSAGAGRVITGYAALAERMRRNGRLRNVDLRECLALSRDQAKRRVAKLVADRVLVQERAGRAASYAPGARWQEWIGAAQ